MAFLDQDRKEDHVTKFRIYQSTIDNPFEKPSVSGHKPGYQVCCRHSTGPDLIIERPKIIPSNEATYSFQDLHEVSVPELQLHLRKNLPQKISKYQGKCMW